MQRLHVHVNVTDLAGSVRFYTTLFGSAPTVSKPDYAKWLLDDPRVNFAISQRNRAAGLDHLGIQVDSGAELTLIADRLREAQVASISEAGTTCCYAKSDKEWAMDPNGLRWESFHTFGSATEYGVSAPRGGVTTVCCGPEADGASRCGPQPVDDAAPASCCGPQAA